MATKKRNEKLIAEIERYESAGWMLVEYWPNIRAFLCRDGRQITITKTGTIKQGWIE
jgi:hypothetical protein